MNRGYVHLHRKLLDSRIFRNPGLLKVWIYCLLKATHKPIWVSVKTGKGTIEVHLFPGQLIFGRESAALELGMIPSTVWKRVRRLKELGALTIESNSQYSVITIVNWGVYQGSPKKSSSQKEIEEQPKDEETPINQETCQEPFRKGDSRVTAKEQSKSEKSNSQKNTANPCQTTLLGNPEEQEVTANKKGDLQKSNTNKKTISNKPSVEDQSDPRVKVFMKWWKQVYERKFESPYAITKYGKEGKQIQALLKALPNFKRLQWRVLQFFNDNDPFIENGGYTIGRFMTNINRYNEKDAWLSPEYKELFIDENGKPLYPKPKKEIESTTDETRR